MKLSIAGALSIAAFSVHGQGIEQNTNAGTLPDPATISLLECHRSYANENYASKATASEIAEAAMAVCQRHLSAAGDSVYREAIEKGFSTDNADSARTQLINQFKEVL